MTPPGSAHIQRDNIARLLDPARCLGSRCVSLARQCGDGDGEVILVGHCLSTIKL